MTSVTSQPQPNGDSLEPQPAGSESSLQETVATANGRHHGDSIDDDVLHTVGRLFHTRPQQNNMIKGRKESMQEIVSRALQAERNHWKDRLQMSLHEIDRLHRVILTTHTGLQDIVKSLRYTLQRNTIAEEEEEERNKEEDQEEAMARLIANLKFQVRQLRVKAGMTEVSKNQYDDSQAKQRQHLQKMKDSISQLQLEKEQAVSDCTMKNEKIIWLQRENVTLQRQLHKLQGIVSRYNESSSGANFHLNIVETPAATQHQSHTVTNKRSETCGSLETLELSDNGVSSAVTRERTYIEGDQISQYPIPLVESAMVKDRLKKNIYSARKGDSRSSNVAKCFRCQVLFKPSENTHRSCRFHHKGREIKEQFDSSGKLERVSYKWACCRKPLETPGCCFGYHV